ncbi:hypothetical protein DSECCO2_356120 [anaerobic digester metagenome]
MLVHALAEDLDLVFPQFLGAVHADVRVAQQVVGRSVEPRLQDDADRGADLDLVLLDVHGLPDGLQQAAGDADGLLVALEIFEQHRELVAAHAGHGIHAAQAGRQALGHLLQQVVAGLVAQGVVDSLEAVEVDHEHGESVLGVAALARHGPVQALQEEDAVGKLRQVVAQGLLGQLRLVSLALGNVAEDEEGPGDGPVQDVGVAEHGHGDGAAVLGPARGFCVDGRAAQDCREKGEALFQAVGRQQDLEE